MAVSILDPGSGAGMTGWGGCGLLLAGRCGASALILSFQLSVFRIQTSADGMAAEGIVADWGEDCGGKMKILYCKMCFFVHGLTGFTGDFHHENHEIIATAFHRGQIAGVFSTPQFVQNQLDCSM